MFSAEVFVFKFGHFCFSGVDRLAEFIAEERLVAAMDAGTSSEFGFELLFDSSRCDANFF